LGIGLAACTTAAVMAALLGQSAAFGTSVPDDVAGKQAATGRTLSPSEDQALIAASDRIQPISDQSFVGSKGDIAQVQATIPAMISRLANLADLPEEAAARQAALPAAAGGARSALASIFAPEVLADQTATVLAGIQERAQVLNMEMMQKADMGAASFQQINLSGDTGRIAFTATTRRLTQAQGWIDEGSSQWQLHIERVNGRWLLLDNVSLNLDGAE
jgi:hypothetical protein